MADLNMLGKIQVAIGSVKSTEGNIKVIGVDGVVRNAVYGDIVYEGEQIVSNDADALFQIKYLKLPEATAYEGIFNLLAEGSVIAQIDESDAIISNDALSNIFETESGKDAIPSSSAYLPTEVVAFTPVLDFVGNENNEYGLGILEFGTPRSATTKDAGKSSDQTAPVITSSNEVIYDENSTATVIQVTATDTSDVTYSLSTDPDSSLFNIDTQSGILNFNSSPNFEDPLDVGQDNRYDITVTATDTAGNFTTQLISIYINNINEAPVALPDTANTTENTEIVVDVLANDTDVDQPDALSLDTVELASTQGSVAIVDNQLVFTPGTDFDYLNEGETTEVVVNYTISDDYNATSGSTLTLTVTGTNDQPVIEHVDANIVESDLTDAEHNMLYTSTENLVASDLDTANEITISQADFAGSYGQETVGLQVSLVQSNPAFMALYTAANNGDATAFIALKNAFVDLVTSPMIAATVGDSATLNTLISNILIAESVADVETVINETPGFSIVATSEDVTLMAEATPSQTAILETSGALNIDVQADGSYTVSSPLFNSLAEGEVVNLTFGYIADDNSEAPNALSDVNTVTLNITGTNDQPEIIVPVVLGALTETNFNDYTYTQEGEDVTLVNFAHVVTAAEVLAAANISDLDTNDTHSIELYNTTINIVFDATTANGAANPLDGSSKGVLQIDSAFVADRGAALGITEANVGDFLLYDTGFDHLGAGEQASFTFYVVANDGTTGANGGESNLSGWESVTVLVTGTNDAPVITIDSDPTTMEAIVEENYAVAGTTIFTADATDIDTNDVLTYSIASVEGDTSGTLYNYFSINETTGEIALTATGTQAVNDSEYNDYTFNIVIGASDTTTTTSQTIQILINDSILTQPTLTLLGDDTGIAGDDITADKTPTLEIGSLDDDILVVTITDASNTVLSEAIRSDDDDNWTATNNLLNLNALTNEWTFTSGQLDDGIHTFTVTVTDDGGNTRTTNYSVTIDSTAPSFNIISNAYDFEIDENTTIVGSAAVRNAVNGQDTGSALSYSFTDEGYQEALFNIDSATGEISFITPPDYETPAGEGGSNDYYMNVKAIDDAGNYTLQAIKVTVENVDEAPTTSLTTYSTTYTDTDTGETVTIVNNELSIMDVDGGSIDLSNVTSSTIIDTVELTGTTELNINVADVITITDDDNDLIISSTDDANDIIHLSDEFNNADGSLNSLDNGSGMIEYTGTDASGTTVIVTIEDTITVD